MSGEVLAQITSADRWTAAAPAMTIPDNPKAILILGGGSISITDKNGVALTLSPSIDSVYPLRPATVTAASNAYILS